MLAPAVTLLACIPSCQLLSAFDLGRQISYADWGFTLMVFLGRFRHIPEEIFQINFVIHIFSFRTKHDENVITLIYSSLLRELTDDFRPWFCCVTFLQELMMEDCSRTIQIRRTYAQVVDEFTDDAKKTLTREKVFNKKITINHDCSWWPRWPPKRTHGLPYL
jgi:hypothetical protein